MRERPNLLLITSDQQHWSTLGVQDPRIKTPNLDRLASMGTVFDRAYTCNPTCTPARASMITGKYPSQHGAYSLGTKLFESETTVGELLRKEGYRTALVGKAHFQPLRGTEEFPSLEAYPTLQDLDFWRDFHGPYYGFEHIELARNHTNEAHIGQHYAIWLEENGCANWRDYFLPPTGNNESIDLRWPIPEAYHYDAWIAERSCALLERYADAGEPFLLWSSFFDPHPNYMAPEPWDAMYDPAEIEVPSLVPGEHDANPPHFQMTQQERPNFGVYQEPGGHACHGFGSHLHDREQLAKGIAVYYGMISLMDKYIGQILDKLDALGLTDNTLVIFTTDHGHFYGHHGLTAKGAFHYEDMIRLPFIVRSPGGPAGRRSEALQSLVDTAPTLLSYAGAPIPRTMAGVDQRAVWEGVEESARGHVFVENRHQPTTVFHVTYVDARYKITAYYGRDYGELFDLEEDPGEIRNLWDSPKHTALKQDLLLKLIHAQMGKDPIPMPRIAGA